jgi:hypothetical protein
VTDILYYEQCGIPKNIKIEFDDTTHASMPSLLPKNDDASSTSSDGSMPCLVLRRTNSSVCSDDSSAEGGANPHAGFSHDFSAHESHGIPQDPFPPIPVHENSSLDKYLKIRSEELRNFEADLLGMNTEQPHLIKHVVPAVKTKI